MDGLVLEPGFEAQYAPAGTRRGRAEDLFDRLPGKLLARCSRMPAEEFHRRIEEVLGDRLRHSFSGAVGLAEIGAPDVTKAAALDRWTVEHGYTAAQVWAFGDMPNDLPMLRWAGAGVAVANAHRRVIDEAGRRTVDQGPPVAAQPRTADLSPGGWVRLAGRMSRPGGRVGVG